MILPLQVFPRGENSSEPTSRGHSPHDPPSLPSVSHAIRQAYFHMAQASPDLDLRFILPPPLHLTPPTPPPSLQHKVGVVLSTLPTFSAVQETAGYKLLSQRVQNSLPSKFQTLTIPEREEREREEGERGEGEGEVEEVDQSLPPLVCYDHVALGGTFDHMHMGHCLLLTETAMLSCQRLLVGVASGPLLQSKVLPELIAPCEERVSNVASFLRDVKWWIQHQVVRRGGEGGEEEEEAGRGGGGVREGQACNEGGWEGGSAKGRHWTGHVSHVCWSVSRFQSLMCMAQLHGMETCSVW